jgi:hypothetical protein
VHGDLAVHAPGEAQHLLLKGFETLGINVVDQRGGGDVHHFQLVTGAQLARDFDSFEGTRNGFVGVARGLLGGSKSCKKFGAQRGRRITEPIERFAEPRAQDGIGVPEAELESARECDARKEFGVFVAFGLRFFALVSGPKLAHNRGRLFAEFGRGRVLHRILQRFCALAQ